MTKEVEPSVKDEQRILLDFIAEPVGWSNGNTSEQQDAAFAALRRLRRQLQEAEERWNSHSCTQKLQGLELVQARSERDAAIERANEAERIGAEDEESLIRSRNEADRLAAELRQAIERAEKLQAEIDAIKAGHDGD